MHECCREFLRSKYVAPVSWQHMCVGGPLFLGVLWPLSLLGSEQANLSEASPIPRGFCSHIKQGFFFRPIQTLKVIRRIKMIWNIIFGISLAFATIDSSKNFYLFLYYTLLQLQQGNRIKVDARHGMSYTRNFRKFCYNGASVLPLPNSS